MWWGDFDQLGDKAKGLGGHVVINLVVDISYGWDHLLGTDQERRWLISATRWPTAG